MFDENRRSNDASHVVCFQALGFDEAVFEAMWPRTITYFSSDEPVVVNRRYARVDRHELCRELLRRCAAGGVRFRATAVEDVEQTSPRLSTLRCEDGGHVTARLVVVAAGAAGLGFIDYEDNDIEVSARRESSRRVLAHTPPR